MNMVSLLALGLVLKYNLIEPRQLIENLSSARTVGLIVLIISAIAVGWSVWQSKREAGDYEVETE
jgi:K(+)-stimulated pyrophosphate-energized sodium pump